MKFPRSVVLCVLCLCWLSYGVGEEAELIALENAIAAAVLTADLDFLEAAYADDFRFTHSTSAVDTKVSWIEALRANPGYYTARRVDRIEVEDHGNVALTTGRLHSKTTSTEPRWSEYSIWYIRVYRREDGRWRLLSHRSIREETGPLQN